MVLVAAAERAQQRLAALLQAGDWKGADLETRTLICTAIGKGARSGLSEEEIAGYPCRVLREVVALWTTHSGGRFGFSVQARLLRECGGDPDRFAAAIGWIHEGLWIYYADVRFAADAPPGHLPVGGPAGLLDDSSYSIGFKAPIENIKSQWLDLAKAGGLKRYGQRTLASMIGKMGFSRLWIRGRIPLLERLAACGDE